MHYSGWIPWALAETGVPVMFVLTQVPLKGLEVHPEANELADYIRQLDLPVAPEGRLFFTMALEDEFSDHPPHGLQDLLDATFKVAPDGVAAALNAAQQIDQDRKVSEARKVVKAAAAVAAAAGATPIPFSDAVVLVPIQMGMMTKTAAIFGTSVDAKGLGTIAGAVFLDDLVTGAGKWAATNLLKLVPGGNVAGGAIRAGAASGLTYAVGEAWIAVCGRLQGLDPDAVKALPTDELRGIFTDEFKRRAKAGAGAAA